MRRIDNTEYAPNHKSGYREVFLISGSLRCRLAPMKAAVFTIKRPLWGVFNAIVLDLHKTL